MRSDEPEDAKCAIEEKANTKQHWLMRIVCAHGELFCAICGYRYIPGGEVIFTFDYPWKSVEFRVEPIAAPFDGVIAPRLL